MGEDCCQRKSNALRLQRENEIFILARLYIAKADAKTALEMLKEWKIDAAENGRLRSQVEALLLEALAHDADSNPSKAKEPLIEALTLGSAKGFRRIFLDEGTRMATLLQAVLPTLPNRSLSLFATTLLHSFSPAATAHLTATSSGVQVEALSAAGIARPAPARRRPFQHGHRPGINPLY